MSTVGPWSRGDRLKPAEVARSLRFVAALPRPLRSPLSASAARAVLVRRLERREADFIAFVGRAVFANPRSPYRRLLALAGCEPGDLAQLVAREGVVDARHDHHGRPHVRLRRRKKLARLKGSVPLRLGPGDLERLLGVHAGAQPWHEGLERAIEPAVRSVVEYRLSQGRELVPDE